MRFRFGNIKNLGAAWREAICLSKKPHRWDETLHVMTRVSYLEVRGRCWSCMQEGCRAEYCSSRLHFRCKWNRGRFLRRPQDNLQPCLSRQKTDIFEKKSGDLQPCMSTGKQLIMAHIHISCGAATSNVHINLYGSKGGGKGEVV